MVTMYAPTSEFTLVIDMRNRMFVANVIEEEESGVQEETPKTENLNSARQEKGTLIASGFIAGGALMGVVSAILKFAKVDWFMYNWNAAYGEAIAIIPLIGIVLYMLFSSLKAQK